MPKPVEAPVPALNPVPPAANLEDMTQPVGPLEKGDQALADAIQSFPEGNYRIENDDGTVSRYHGKTKTSDGSNGVNTTITLQDAKEVDSSTDESGKQLAAGIFLGSQIGDRDPGSIAAQTREWSSENRAGKVTSDVQGNEVQTGTTSTTMEVDRVRAQAQKLEMAKQINDARERIGKLSVGASTRE